jgi:hypothetical protein
MEMIEMFVPNKNKNSPIQLKIAPIKILTMFSVSPRKNIRLSTRTNAARGKIARAASFKPCLISFNKDPPSKKVLLHFQVKVLCIRNTYFKMTLF